MQFYILGLASVANNFQNSLSIQISSLIYNSANKAQVPGMVVVHAHLNSSTREAETDHKFESDMGYIARPYLKIQK